MRNQKIATSLGALIICIVILITSASYKQYKKNTIQCTINSVTHINDYMLRAIFTYDLDWGDGVIIINGQLFKAGKSLGNFSRKVFFTYTIDGNGYNMNSTRTLVSLSDQANTNALDDVLPVFYLKANEKYNIAIFNQGKNNFVFASSNFPSFYCYQ